MNPTTKIVNGITENSQIDRNNNVGDNVADIIISHPIMCNTGI